MDKRIQKKHDLFEIRLGNKSLEWKIMMSWKPKKWGEFYNKLKKSGITILSDIKLEKAIIVVSSPSLPELEAFLSIIRKN